MIPSSNSYFEFGWNPKHPDIIRKYDKSRMIKRKMKRWPPEEDRFTTYAWFKASSEGSDPGDFKEG